LAQQIRKLVRTVQSELFFLKEARDALYLHGRRLLAKPHEREFYALRFVPPSLPGVFVDVGANQGQSIESIKLMRPEARVVSFEANPGLASKLQQRYAGRRDITIRSYGLSDRVETRSLFVPVYRKFVYDGNASFDRESALALYNSDNLFRFDPSRLELRELDCSVQRLDEQGLEPLFIKIDVQGFEHRVILGGLETIRKHQPILMVECLYDHPELIALLRSIGYEEYVFDQQGFRRGRSTNGAINQIVMTQRRARDVIFSPRAIEQAEAAALEARPS
jgi:FkbM family methyltransferase